MQSSHQSTINHHQLTRLFLICCLWLSLFARNYGQTEDDFAAWIDTENVDGKTVLSCWVSNNSAELKEVRYRAVLTKNGVAEVRENTTLTLPRHPTLLLKSIFVVEDGTYERLSVEVFKDETLVASAFLAGSAPNLPEQISPPPSIEPDAPSFGEVEIEGLILDETRSKLAHDFYELFYSQWIATDSLSGGATITIREQPVRIGIGTRISVEVDGQELSQLNLQPRLDVLEDLAGQLVAALKEYMNNPDNAIREIEAEEMQGTGIY